MQLGKSELNAEFYGDISVSEISSSFNLPIKFEKPVKGNELIKELIDTPLKPFALAIQNTLKKASEHMKESNIKDLASFIVKTLQSGPQKKKAQNFINSIIKFLPESMDDSCIYKDQRIAFHSKAQELVNELHKQFSSKNKLFICYI